MCVMLWDNLKILPQHVKWHHGDLNVRASKRGDFTLKINFIPFAKMQKKAKRVSVVSIVPNIKHNKVNQTADILNKLARIYFLLEV